MTGRQLVWRTTGHARRLVTVMAVALVVGIAFARPAVVALAAVPVAFLLLRHRGVGSDRVRLRIERGADRCFEGEPVSIEVSLDLDAPVEMIRVLVQPGRYVGWHGDPPGAWTFGLGDPVGAVGELGVRRWGRRALGTVNVTLVDSGGIVEANARESLGEVSVFPRPSNVDRSTVPVTRGGMLGDHPARIAGSGVEFGGIRPYAAGDSAARINWPTSLRLQRLHITERVAEHAADIVLVIDALTDVGPEGMSSRDLSVRGAAGLARSLLHVHDRVGVVALGGHLRWLRPDLGDLQFYRIVELVLDVVDDSSFVDPDVARLPAAAIPARAQVVVFSPLLDERMLQAVEQLRARGLAVRLIDVLTVEPPGRTDARRLWRLDREAMMGRLAEVGVMVARWDGQTSVPPILRSAVTSERARV